MATFPEKFGTKYLTMDEMLAAMLDAGKTDDEILTAIVGEYAPYDKITEFGYGFSDGLAYKARNQFADIYEGVAGQAYDRGLEAAMYFHRVQDILRPQKATSRLVPPSLGD